MEKFEAAFALEQPDAPAGQSQEPQRWLIPELLHAPLQPRPKPRAGSESEFLAV
jgi:hypothetical protein